MKNAKRLFFGVLSSLLLAVGFVRAAERLDPVSQDLAGVRDQQQLKVAADCSGGCVANCNAVVNGD